MKRVLVRFARVVRQEGVLEMDADSIEEAVACVRLMGRQIALGSSVDLKANWSVPDAPHLEVVGGREV